MKSISIIIPTYNGNELLEKYLPLAVEACKNYKGQWEIIVVDDGGEKIPLLTFSKRENIKYIRRQQNGGFSKAMNTGIKEAAGEIIIALNNDVMVTSSFIEPLIKYFDNPLVFSVKPESVVFHEHSATISKMNFTFGKEGRGGG